MTARARSRRYQPPRNARDPLELRCETCGGEELWHVRAARRWRNSCGECGARGEYIPTRAEIAQRAETLKRRSVICHEHYLWRWMPAVGDGDGQEAETEFEA